MVTEGNELEVKGTTLQAETPESEVPTEETKQVNPVEAELQRLKAENQQFKELIGENPDGYKGLQRKLNQVNDELKKKSASESRLDTLEQSQRILIAMLSERENINNLDEIPEGKKTDYLKQYDEVLKMQQLKLQQEEFAVKVRDYQQRTDAIGLAVDSEDYMDIRDFVTAGKFDRAEAKLKKLEAHTVETKKTETPEEMEARLRKEIEKKILDERGLLESETGLPSGTNIRTFTQQQIADMPMEEYIKLRPEIEKAMAAGKVK